MVIFEKHYFGSSLETRTIQKVVEVGGMQSCYVGKFVAWRALGLIKKDKVPEFRWSIASFSSLGLVKVQAHGWYLYIRVSPAPHC